MGFLGDFKDIVRLLNEVLGMFRQLSVQGRQKDKDGGGVLPSSEKRRIAAGVQAFFERNYDLRYNVMKQTEEFRRKAPPGDPEALIGQPEPLIDGPDGWQQLTDREFNRIVVEQMAQEGAGWAVDVELYVRSALVPAYSPVADYLKHCEPWDGQTDHIRRMAMRVPTDYKWWRLTFTEMCEMIKIVSATYPLARKKIVEKKANGQAVIDTLNSEIGGFVAYDPKMTDKVGRANAISPYIQSGNVWFPKESVDNTIEEMIEEMMTFPNSDHDDEVDAMTQYLNVWATNTNGKFNTSNTIISFSKVIRGLYDD